MRFDQDEIQAIKHLAEDEPEVGEELEIWARASIRGKSQSADRQLLDRLGYFLIRAKERFQERRRSA